MAFYVKDLSVLNLDPKLIEIANWVKKQFGLDVVTSAYRPEDPGVHGDHRGLDLRCRNIAKGEEVEAAVNERWEYDPERPSKKCALYHDAGSGIHLHLQVHPNTRRRQ